MSTFSYGFNKACTLNDKKRDKNLKELEDVTACFDILYQQGGKYNRLDVYYPNGTEDKLPVIVSVHGGAYVYGTKEVYKHYGMFMAEQGFSFVNFNYHLAPKKKFPTQLTEINQVLEWMVKNEEEFHFDLNNIFIVGDSAGAQMASHYCTVYSNSEFAKKFSFTIPKEIKIRAVALNCGMYDISAKAQEAARKLPKDSFLNINTLLDDYLGKERSSLEELLQVEENIMADFPPTFVMTSQYDFLKDNAKPMQELLESKGVKTEFKLYGKEGQKYMGHVFHCNMNLEEAKECNRDECEFFRQFIQKKVL